MKTLYISDLDGTLLNSKKEITKYTAQVLNDCIERGMLFSVATARMAYACDYRLADIKLSAPGILTNGVFLYDFVEKKYVSAEVIDQHAIPLVLDAFKRNGASCFLYTFDNRQISLYFDDPALTQQTQYYSERALKSCAEVKLLGDLQREIPAHAQVVYMALTGTSDELLPICEDLKQIAAVSFAYYLNIYNGLYCIEVFSCNASKKKALQKLKGLMHYDELVVFGDNLNDLSMMEIADRSYAPANALDIVKEKVTSVLDDCDNDGVAKFLAQEWGI